LTRLKNAALNAAITAAAIFCLASVATQAQNPSTTPPAATATPAAPAKPPAAEENPFAPQPAPPLPAGMTGSDTSDPRYSLKPGMYDAGEAAMGMKHLAFLKSRMRFRLTLLLLMILWFRRP